MKNFLTDVEIKEIESIVHESEKKISGEIVPVIVQRSSTYYDAPAKAGLAFGIVGLMFSELAYMMNPWNIFANPIYLFLAFASVGYILVFYVSSLRVFFAGSFHRNEAVNRRARLSFLDHEVFNTKQRTGILIFISMQERQVVILGDSGISKKVSQDQWDEIVKNFVTKIKLKKYKDGLIEIIQRCESLLLKNGFTIVSGDQNELSNELRFDDENK